MKLHGDDENLLHLAVMYDLNYAGQYDRAASRVLNAVRGNLTRALAVSRQFADGIEESVAQTAITERLDCAAFVLDARMKVRAANQEAGILLSTERPFLVRRGETIALASHDGLAFSESVKRLARRQSSAKGSDLVLSKVMRQRYATGLAKSVGAARGIVMPDPGLRIDRCYFNAYRGAGPYGEVWHRFSDPAYICELIDMVWQPEAGFRLLVAGSASGELVGALRELGIDAWGVENNRYIHAKTPAHLIEYNLLGMVADLPFEDGSFDFVYETCLAYLGKRGVGNALRELHRVVKRGVYFGSVTADLTSEVCDMYDLLRGVKKLATWWEWSQLFFDNDFDMAIQRDEILGSVWERTLAANKGPGHWYEDAESLRYCFFNRVAPDGT